MTFTIVVVYGIFNMELSAQIYINYRANPPKVVCSTLLEAYSASEIE